jgi:hypothetical protein
MSENRKKPSLPPSGPKVFVQQSSRHFETITFEEAMAQSQGKGLILLSIPDMTPPGWDEIAGIAASDPQTMNALTELAHRLQHSVITRCWSVNRYRVEWYVAARHHRT